MWVGRSCQYMARGCGGCQSSRVHMDMVRHGETGYLAETPEQWVTAIRRLTAMPSSTRLGAAGGAVSTQVHVTEEESLDGFAGRPERESSLGLTGRSPWPEVSCGKRCAAVLPALQPTEKCPLSSIGDGLRLAMARRRAGHRRQAGPHRRLPRAAAPARFHCEVVNPGKPVPCAAWQLQRRPGASASTPWPSRDGNVPTVEPLAIGEARAGSSCLLLRALEGRSAAWRFLEWQLSSSMARGRHPASRLAQRLGQFVARLHDAASFMATCTGTICS